ncbi:MAG: methyltransferase domain-containing protein [Deltaproteobacteria bacterium]|nr:methyltransferase domain-containing protein [Deltaproteobacteria bacterium]
MNTTLNPATVEEFSHHMLTVLNHGAIALMLSIGHRTGLFDTMAELPASTSGQIARAAGLQERYVREWLGAMVTGRIVTYDAASDSYKLPPEHAASLTRAATPNNMAMFMQYIPLLGAVEDAIVECFRHGGGVPYAAFPRFQHVMAEESSQTVAAALVDAILPLAPGIIEALRSGIEVLDVGCGRGHALNMMAKAFPQSRFTGYDFSKEGIAAGKTEAHAWGLTNVRFAVKDMATMEDHERYGLITAFDAIHDQAKPRDVLKRIASALKPDGIFLMLRILVEVISDSGERDQVPRPRTLESVTLL